MVKCYVILFAIQILLCCGITPIQAETPYQGSNNATHAIDSSYTYTILVPNNQKHTISQKYSWSAEDTGRYNLFAYSFDKGPIVPINRTGNGNLTLNTDSSHTVIFFAKRQFEISLHGQPNVTFFPPSPTNDNWFDKDSDTQFVVSRTIPSDNNNTRQQLNGWSLDGPDINVISWQDSDSFKSPAIHMSEMHTVNLHYTTQHHIKVISNFGQARGTGWYDSGTIVDIVTTPGNDIFLVNHIFSGWQGPVIGDVNQETTEVMVNSPEILVAYWSVDYTNLSIVIIVAISVLVLFRIYQKRKNTLKK